MRPIIKIEGVEKIYQMGNVEVPALRGIDIEIKRGEFVAIMGSSGSGKSTLMNSIGVLDMPTKGKIFLDDIDVSKLEESSLSQIRGKKIGFVFQQFNLIRTISAIDNVILPMIFQRVSYNRRSERAKELLNLVGLRERFNHLPTELSGGEQQRVAIARALSNDPELILADEPTGNLDSKTGIGIMNLLSNLHEKDKKTIVIITHDAKLAKYAKRIVRIKDGRIEK